jgi:sarcosine oxidase
VRVGVVGAGVVGLSTAACLRRDGVEAVGFERAQSVMGERSAGSSRIFRLAHVDADLVRLAVAALDGFTRWGPAMVDPVGCVVSGADAAERAAAMASWTPMGAEKPCRTSTGAVERPLAGGAGPDPSRGSPTLADSCHCAVAFWRARL